MNLLFHDRSEAPAQQGVPYLTIERGGNFALNAAAVEALGLQTGQPMLLVQDTESQTWYLYPGSQPGTEPFTLRQRDGKKSKAMLFGSTAKAKAYYAANGHDLKTLPSVRLSILPAAQLQGLTLYPLSAQASQQPVVARAQPKAKAALTLVPTTPDEATVRIQRLVTELGGLLLHRVEEDKLTRALGTLRKYPNLVPTVAGAAALLAKLESHFSKAA